ncbi:MAG: hypothetical protein H8E66_16135 [Planctomycetes bacterium]|nr:hypothetical protein [Planctomycetota bacterium]
MTVHYPRSKGKFRYICSTGRVDRDVPLCQDLSGQVVDDLVAEIILQAMEPAALELSLLAAGDLEQDRKRLDQNWQQRLQRTRYEADRAQRQCTKPWNWRTGWQLRAVGGLPTHAFPC